MKIAMFILIAASAYAAGTTTISGPQDRCRSFPFGLKQYNAAVQLDVQLDSVAYPAYRLTPAYCSVTVHDDLFTIGPTRAGILRIDYAGGDLGSLMIENIFAWKICNPGCGGVVLAPFQIGTTFRIMLRGDAYQTQWSSGGGHMSASLSAFELIGTENLIAGVTEYRQQNVELFSVPVFAAQETPTPEPSTFGLAAVAVAGLAWRRRFSKP